MMGELKIQFNKRLISSRKLNIGPLPGTTSAIIAADPE
jgi:hypothetical protein